MGKLIEKLRQVGQGSGGTFGFFGRGQAAGAPARPAAVLVTLTASQVAAAESAAKAGVDAVVIAGWKPGADISAITSALESASALWGVEYSGGADDELAAAAQKAGAGFLLLGPDAPASALYEQSEQFDRVITLSAPVNEMDLQLYRMANALPAQAAAIQLPVGMRDLPKQTVSEAARLALLSASVRFPLLAMVDEAPGLQAARTLVRLGFDGIVLGGVGASAEQIAEQTKSLRADLEKIPLSEGQSHESVSLGGLVNTVSAAQQKPAEPEKDPERE